MNIFTQFKKAFSPTSEGVVTSSSGAKVALFDETATDGLIKMLTHMPDVDEVLKQAGIKRSHLRVLTFDDEISQACETRLDALLGVPVRFEPNEGPDAALLADIMRPLMADAVSGAFQARLFGYSVLEAVYHQRIDGKIGLSFLGEKPFEWFEPRSDGRLLFYPRAGALQVESIEVDQQFKFFLTRARATYRNPYGAALLSKLYWPWFFRQNGWKFWAKFLERFGAPLLVGKSSDPTAMVSALLMAHSQAVIGVDLNDSVETIGTAAGNSGAAFETFEAAIIRRIQKVVLGQTLTSGTDGGSGNRALGQVHDGVRLDKRNSDVALVQPTIQRIVNALCSLNNWAMHTVVFADDVGLESDRATRDNDLYKVGVRFEKSYFEDNYALREGDFTLVNEALPADGSPPVTAPNGNNAKPESLRAAEAVLNLGDSAEVGKSPPHFFSNDGTERVFTPAQQVIEDVAALSLSEGALPVNPGVLRAAILAASSPEDLEDRLFALLGKELSTEAFSRTLESAFYVADVVGYVSAENNAV